ncbi:hypothetical protein KCU67_g5214, partial [Aureobasidium melanogenum]
MAPSVEIKGSKESKAAKQQEWERSTWNAEIVIKIIASSSDMITIVGQQSEKDGKIFSASVHKELLCFFSPYYTAALKGGFAEAQKNTLTLNLSSRQMANFVSWLYSGNTLDVHEFQLLDLYIFADEKMMLAFCRSIMSTIVRFHDFEHEQFDQDKAMPFLKVLPQNSGLFRYLSDYWVGVWGRNPDRSTLGYWDDDDRIPKAFFYNALELFSSQNEGYARAPPPDYTSCLKKACNYHEHVDKEEWLNTCGIVYGPARRDDEFPASKYLQKQQQLGRGLCATFPVN